MPLSPPASRTLSHTRQIVLHGYHRDDGLFDIEAALTDVKSYSFTMEDRGTIEPGEPLHGMAARMTVDETLLITAFEAHIDYGPYNTCAAATPNFALLAGIRIGRGFLRAAAAHVGGVDGCTHLREMLQQMATVAFQTLYQIRAARNFTDQPGQPALLDTCHSYRADGPVVQRRWPEHFTGG